MRIQIPLVIEMTDEQVKNYADEYGLSRDGEKLMAKTVVEDVCSYVLTCIQDSAAFGEIGDGAGTRGATVSIKR